jgi:hypothetical protein
VGAEEPCHDSRECRGASTSLTHPEHESPRSILSPSEPILIEMEPTGEERLARIREVTDSGLHYLATAYLNTDIGEEHVIAERDLLMTYMTQVANVVALLEGSDLGDRAMLSLRDEVVSRYLEAAVDDPWIPPTPPAGS